MPISYILKCSICSKGSSVQRVWIFRNISCDEHYLEVNILLNIPTNSQLFLEVFPLSKIWLHLRKWMIKIFKNTIEQKKEVFFLKYLKLKNLKQNLILNSQSNILRIHPNFESYLQKYQRSRRNLLIISPGMNGLKGFGGQSSKDN